MRKLTIAAFAVFGVLLAGCSNLETSPAEQGIRYSGGVLFPEAVEFKNCQLPSKQEFGGPGDNTFTYPAGQRTYKFSNDPGSDSPPLTASAPSPGGGQPIELTVSGTVTFTPAFDNCDTLRAFHERVGLKYEAWTAEGWNRMLSIYIKDIADRAIDSEALKFNWVSLTSDANAKAAWEQAVILAIPTLLAEQAGAEFFEIDNVLLQRPELPESIRGEIAATEGARQQAATAEQVRIAAETFPGGVAAYQSYQQQQAVNEAIRSGRVQVLPVPIGSPVILNPGVPG